MQRVPDLSSNGASDALVGDCCCRRTYTGSNHAWVPCCGFSGEGLLNLISAQITYPGMYISTHASLWFHFSDRTI